jgi:hypothetical protein
MDDAVDLHHRLLKEQDAVRRCRQALAYLEEAGTEYVVEGGWAVAAHGNPVESVDLDVILAFDELERFKQEMLSRHLQLDATGAGVLGIDTRDLHAHNPRTTPLSVTSRRGSCGAGARRAPCASYRTSRRPSRNWHSRSHPSKVIQQ